MSDPIDMTVEEEELALEEAEVEEDGDAEAEPSPAEPQGEPEPEDPPAVAELRRQNEQLKGWAGSMRHQNTALKSQVEKVEGRLERIVRALAEKEGIDVAALTGEAPAEEPIPDADEDVTGHIVGSVRKALGEFKQELEEKDQEREKATKIATFTTQVKDYHEADAAAFSEEHPDYDEVERVMTDYVLDQQVRALSVRYPDASEEEIRAAAQRETINLAADLQIRYALAGKSLAQATYERARELGLVAAGEEEEAPKPRAPRTAAEKLKASRQRAGKSLAAAPGTPGKAGSIKSLLEMSDDEFDEALEGRDWKKVAGAIGGV